MSYFNRAISWSELKELDKAIEDLTEAIRLNPEYARAYNNRGWCLLGKKEYDRAIKDFDISIRMEPTDDVGPLGQPREMLE